nr:unnamed protein product [uncultured bacterium]
MYEGKAGAERLAGALERAAADQERLELLANILFYDADQLKQDIKAIEAEIQR